MEESETPKKPSKDFSDIWDISKKVVDKNEDVKKGILC